MQKLVFLSLFIFLTALDLLADKSCPLCGLILNDSQLIVHVIKDHPMRDSGPAVSEHESKRANLGLSLISMYEYIHSTKPVEVWDRDRYKEVWDIYLDYSLKYNCAEQTITMGIDKYDIRHYCDCGGALLLFALYYRNYSAVIKILEKPDDLAYLDVVDTNGKNSLNLAEEIAASCPWGSDEQERWQEITARLLSLFRFAKIKSPERHTYLNRDFYWRKPNQPQKVDCVGWRNRTEEEAMELINPQLRQYGPNWMGLCSDLQLLKIVNCCEL